MENKTLTTPAGKELVLKTFLSAGARNRIRDVILGDMQIDPTEFGEHGGSVTGVDKISGAVLSKQEKAVITELVVSYDGKTENVFGVLEEGSPEEYDFVVKSLNEITKGKQSAK